MAYLHWKIGSALHVRRTDPLARVKSRGFNVMKTDTLGSCVFVSVVLLSV